MTRCLSCLATVLAVVALGTQASPGAHDSLPGRGPFLLVSLPSLGVVTWRCGPRAASYGLGFRTFAQGATTDIRLVADGRTVRRARVDPGRAVRLPLRGLVQRLQVEQFTGAGTLRATVVVRFETTSLASHCFGYSPPALEVRVTPRR